MYFMLLVPYIFSRLLSTGHSESTLPISYPGYSNFNMENFSKLILNKQFVRLDTDDKQRPTLYIFLSQDSHFTKFESLVK